MTTSTLVEDLAALIDRHNLGPAWNKQYDLLRDLRRTSGEATAGDHINEQLRVQSRDAEESLKAQLADAQTKMKHALEVIDGHAKRDAAYARRMHTLRVVMEAELQVAARIGDPEAEARAELARMVLGIIGEPRQEPTATRFVDKEEVRALRRPNRTRLTR